MKFLILGSGGFIGSYLVQGLRQRNFTVLALSRKECDLLDPESIASSVPRLDSNWVVVFVATVSRLVENSLNSMQQNIAMITNLCSFLQKFRVFKVIFFSTIDVYGLVDGGEIISEDTMLAPNDAYSTAKAVSEYILRKEMEKLGISLTVFRLVGIYGIGDQGKSTVNSMVSSLRKNGRIVLYGDGSNLRDYVYVGDLVRLVVYSLWQKDGSIVVNVATGKSKSIYSLARMIVGILGCSEQSIVLEQKSSESELRVKHLQFDTAKFRKIFSGLTLTPIEIGLANYCESVYCCENR